MENLQTNEIVRKITDAIENLNSNFADLLNLAWELYLKHENDSLADSCYKFWENCDTVSLNLDDITDYFQNEINKPF